MNDKQRRAMFAKTRNQLKLVKSLSQPNNQKSYDFWHGVVDKFPPCCIDYYSNVYSKGKFIERKHIGNPDLDKIQTKNERIMCPDCLLDNLKKN